MDLPLTGERTLPGIPAENYWFQRHVAAYLFAAKLARGTVLDAGCGEGYGAAILSRTADRVVAMDMDEPTLDHVRSRYPAPWPVRGDLSSPPFTAGSLDVVVALQVIEHLSDADVFVVQCARVLRQGGLLILSTPNVATFPNGLNPFHTHEYNASELLELLDGHFDSVDLSGVAHGARLRWIERTIKEPIPNRLIRSPYAELPVALRAALRTVTSGAFRVVPDVNGSLDLLAVCRNIES